MQPVSGTVGLSLALKGTSGGTETYAEAQADMSSGLGFLALLATQIDSAKGVGEVSADLADIMTLIAGQTDDALTTKDNSNGFSGNIMPQTLPFAAMPTKQNIDPEKLLSHQNIDSEKVLSQLLGVGAGEGEWLDEKMLSSIGSELKSVKSLLNGLQQGQGDPDNTLIQGLVQAAGNGGVRGQSPQVGLPGFASIASQPGDQAWGDELVSRVKWQVGQELQEAKIQLNPRELGPLQIKINIHDDQATVQFVAQHGVVRDAIEDAMPRLREMLEQSGLNLADANVSQGSQDEQQAFSEEADTKEQNRPQGGESEMDVATTEGIIKSGTGLVDAFV